MEVVICGGGIIGTSIAYHLALKGVKSTIVERCHLACAASGKAGGFLAREWCDDNELGPLARLSYSMHMKLAQNHEFKHCGYRNLDTLSVSVRDKVVRPVAGLSVWLDGTITQSSSIGDTSCTAQVHPYHLTNTFFNQAKVLVGTELVVGVVESVIQEGGKVTGVKVDGARLAADVVIVALGAWSGQAMSWFSLTQVTSRRAHSLVLKPTQPVPPEACFIEYTGRLGTDKSPEVYPRPDDTVYICGGGDKEELPTDPRHVKVNPEAIANIKDVASTMSSAFRDAEVVAEQACYLPISPDGLPVIGALPGVTGGYIATGHSFWGILNSPATGALPGVTGGYIATGHSFWGILNSPATGAVMAELVVDGRCSLVDVSPYDPSRLL